MLLLALDTSTSAITVAVHDGARALGEQSVLDARKHSEHLSPLVVAALADAGVSVGDLTDLAVGTGPGPFTGLRVGLVTARVLGMALGVPVHGVCSLDALAHAARDLVEGDLLVATDARRKEVYWATYSVRAGSARRLGVPAVHRPTEVPEDVRALPTAGRGPVLWPELLPHGIPLLDVSATALAEVAVARIATGEDMPVDALYLRRPDATPSASATSTVPGGWRPS